MTDAALFDTRRISFLIAVAASLILIAVLLFVRSRVRTNRQRTVEELRLLFFPNEQISIAAFDYVRAKYEMEISVERRGDASLSKPASTWPLLVSAIPYAIICAIGFITLLMPYKLLTDPQAEFTMVHDGLFWAMAGEPTTERLREAAAVLAAAFLGGYLMTGRMLLRAVQNYELSQLTFLQAATHLAFGIVSGMMVYHVLRGIGMAVGLVGDLPQFNGFLLVAFLGGYAPDLGMAILIQYLRFRMFKPTDRDALGKAHTMPLELIDGIDYDTRHRLDQAGITDAQILATANPILIYVETPYGLYCAFDWVLQAQLCVAVGTPTFQRLKQRNVRTSLDLERAILGDDAPEDLVADLGRIIFPPVQDGSPPLSIAAVKHGVMVMLDDLHIHRVRMLWRHIFVQIAGETETQWLYRKDAVLQAALQAEADADAAAAGIAPSADPEQMIVAVPAADVVAPAAPAPDPTDKTV